MFKRLYQWTLSLADSPRATWALAAIAFAESSFFPLPPDIILAPMSLARPQKAWFYAIVCTIASVTGGALGYFIGSGLYDTVGQWLIHFYGYDSKADVLRGCYDKYGWIIILLKGLTPIPYKLVTIISGFAGYNFALFILLSLITRGARFFILAGILNRFGEPIKAALDRHFAVFMGLILFMIVFGFWLVSRMGGSGAC
ncbi:MAG: DedA family protein [Hyphomicrobiales bacterium]|nr:DedA family protein [Hyphomicrobiales bacterium]